MLENTTSNPDGAGEAVIRFHFGSRYDQCDGWDRPLDEVGDIPNRSRATELSCCCNEIRFWVCDDCFEKYAHLFSGYVTDTTKTERRVL